MKRAVLSAVFLAAVAVLGGCPIYSHEDDGCWRDKDCQDGYLCDDSSGVCYVPGSGSGSARCARPSDCGVNQTCSSAGLCVSGDCSFSGCVSGYRCDRSSEIWQCVSGSSSTPSGGAGGGANQGAEAGSAGAESSLGSAGAAGTDALASAGSAGEAGGG